MITPLYGEDGELAWYLGSQVELGAEPDAGFAARKSRAEALMKRFGLDAATLDALCASSRAVDANGGMCRADDTTPDVLRTGFDGHEGHRRHPVPEHVDSLPALLI